MNNIECKTFGSVSSGHSRNAMRMKLMFMAGALPVLVMAALAAVPFAVRAQSQSCTDSPSAGGQNYLIVCRGSDGAQGGPDAGIGAQGAIPNAPPITLNGNFSGVAGQSTIDVESLAGTGGRCRVGRRPSQPAWTPTWAKRQFCGSNTAVN